MNGSNVMAKKQVKSKISYVRSKMGGKKWLFCRKLAIVTDYKVNGRDRRERELRTRTPSPERAGTRHQFPSISDGRYSLKVKWYVEIIGCISHISLIQITVVFEFQQRLLSVLAAKTGLFPIKTENLVHLNLRS